MEYKWKVLKEYILRVAKEGCGIPKYSGNMKHPGWWDDGIKLIVSRKK